MKKIKTAKDIMVTNMVTFSPNLSIYDATILLLKCHRSGIPVIDKEGKFLGEINMQSCLNALLDVLHEEGPGTLEVRQYLRQDDVTISEDTNLAAIAEKFQGNRQRILPVLKEEKLVGLVSRRDVIEAVVDYLKSAPDKKTHLLYLSAVKSPDEIPGELM